MELGALEKTWETRKTAISREQVMRCGHGRVREIMDERYLNGPVGGPKADGYSPSGELLSEGCNQRDLPWLDW